MSRTLTALSLLALTGCLSTDNTSSKTIEETTFAASLNIDLKAMTKTASGLYYRDLVVGTGAVVASGQTVGVHYTGWLANGTQFDTNGPSDPPISFVLGVGQVIPGWDEGVPGMHVGGTRQLVIPPELGYGNVAVGPIPPGSILVFVVQMVSAK